VPYPKSFIANPGKRFAAFAYDTIATAFLFYVFLGLTYEATGQDLTSWGTYSAALFVYQLGFLAMREGRTLGKEAQDICVLGVDGNRPQFVQAVLRAGSRALPLALLDSDPPLSNLTTIVVLALFIADFWALGTSASRQTLADRIARTLVVNIPPPQPHRAPAVPMYSATDQEFGAKPQPPGDKKRK